MLVRHAAGGGKMIERLVRKHFLKFRPYQSARSAVTSANILLDANELSEGSPLRFDGIQLNRYPDPLQHELRSQLAALHSVSVQNVFVGVGSDEIIDLVIRLFCEPGRDGILVWEPTYGVYRVAAEINAVDVVSRELDEEFQINSAEALGHKSSPIKLIFCCSPNNPTGNLLRYQDIARICDEHDRIVVVDEAYIDFAGNENSVLSRIGERENLIVLRTMSKSFGLAGARLGYCITHPAIVDFLLKIKAPYNMNVLTSYFGLRALNEISFLQTSVRNIVARRLRLTEELNTLPVVKKVFPSDANFLLVKFEDAGNVHACLARRGIIVRKRTEPRLRDCLRITVGTEEENRLVIEELGKIR